MTASNGGSDTTALSKANVKYQLEQRNYHEKRPLTASFGYILHDGTVKSIF